MITLNTLRVQQLLFKLSDRVRIRICGRLELCLTRIFSYTAELCPNSDETFLNEFILLNVTGEHSPYVLDNLVALCIFLFGRGDLSDFVRFRIPQEPNVTTQFVSFSYHVLAIDAKLGPAFRERFRRAPSHFEL
ncbi:MAG: hypothetical protein IT365_04495 [Candidatus Hydrogenedentes bacterium]|nr:hypothetical protein [Candidatus Hydrogenedentota bacterium]